MAEEEDGGYWDAQAVPLLNATTFGAVYLALGRQSIGMPFHAEVSLMQGIEVPCQTLEQHRRAAMYVPPAATWVLLASPSIYELCKINHDRRDGAPGSTPDGVEWLWCGVRAGATVWGGGHFGRRGLVSLQRLRS